MNGVIFINSTVSFSCGLHVNILFRSVLNKQKHAFCMILLHIHIYIYKFDWAFGIYCVQTNLINSHFFPSKCKWFGSITAVIISVAHLQCCREELELAGIVLVSGKMYHPTRRLCCDGADRPSCCVHIHLRLGLLKGSHHEKNNNLLKWVQYRF